MLMDISSQLGHQGGVLSMIHEDVKETKQEAKATNGKVLKLRSDVDDLQQQLLQLKELPVKPKGIDWQKTLVFLGAIATIIAFTIEKLWK